VVEGHFFLLLYVIASFLLDLPSASTRSIFHVPMPLRAGWGKLVWRPGKTFLITMIGGGLLLMLLFWVIRKLPSTWWLLFWLSHPHPLFGLFVSPYIKPSSFHYEPLSKTNLL